MITTSSPGARVICRVPSAFWWKVTAPPPDNDWTSNGPANPPGATRHGSPARLLTRTNCVLPPLRTALTRNAPSVRRLCTVTSGQADGTPGKIRTMPPQLCTAMSCMVCAPDSGVSMTGPASLYIVFGWTNLSSSEPSWVRAWVPSPRTAYIDPEPVNVYPCCPLEKLSQWLSDLVSAVRLVLLVVTSSWYSG